MDRRTFATLLASSMLPAIACSRNPLLPVLPGNALNGESDMSHHLDTPLAWQNGQLYIDDLYVFAGDHSTVFVMDVNSTITGPHVQPGFHHEARYEFKIHFEGAESESLTYRASFDDHPDKEGRQNLQLHELTGDDARKDSAQGTLVLQGRTGEIVKGPHTRLWAGRSNDSFYVDLSLLTRVNTAVRKGTPLDLSDWQPQKAQNSFAGTFVETIALEVSHEHSRLRPGANIGVWCATKLATDAGGWRQINRAGHPMMWPIFWPDDVRFTNPQNTRHPSEDFQALGQPIAELIAAAVKAAGTSDNPQAYGRAVAKELFPDVLRYKVGTPATYSFAGRNGARAGR